MNNPDFNKEAMEHKIKLNIEAGWKISGMYLALLREQKKLLESMQILETRDTELNDQVEYLKENYNESLGL